MESASAARRRLSKKTGSVQAGSRAALRHLVPEERLEQHYSPEQLAGLRCIEGILTDTEAMAAAGYLERSFQQTWEGMPQSGRDLLDRSDSFRTWCAVHYMSVLRRVIAGGTAGSSAVPDPAGSVGGRAASVPPAGAAAGVGGRGRWECRVTRGA